ncbi:MAG: hypothetical protein ACLQSR_08010 [Limisphaerales bacterium]
MKKLIICLAMPILLAGCGNNAGTGTDTNAPESPGMSSNPPAMNSSAADTNYPVAETNNSLADTNTPLTMSSNTPSATFTNKP